MHYAFRATFFRRFVVLESISGGESTRCFGMGASFDREFFLAGCIICHPTERLGTINLADQSGAKNWFDPNPNNESMTFRGIGPDAH